MKQQKNSFSEKIQKIVTNKKWQMIGASCACAFVLSFSFVAISRLDVGGQSLMASVTNLQNQAQVVNFDADIALFQSGSEIRLVIGKNMEKVDRIEGIIALNPTLGVILSANGSLQLVQESEGMYRFILDKNSENIWAGTEIAKIIKNTEDSIPVNFIDTQFVSSGERYNLSNIVE